MRILVVDDHALVRRGMSYVVKEGFPDAEVVGGRESRPRRSRCCTAGKGRSTSHSSTCACPTSTGSSCCAAIKAEWPEIPVIMLSTYENAPYVKRALSDGAVGLPAEGRHARGPVAGDQRRDVGQRQRAEPARDPEPVRGAGGSGTGVERDAAAQRVQPDPAGERHPGAAGRGPVEPRDRAVAVPVGEDREGPPGRDLPQARRHEPHAGRDDGRADGCRARCRARS